MIESSLGWALVRRKLAEGVRTSGLLGCGGCRDTSAGEVNGRGGAQAKI